MINQSRRLSFVLTSAFVCACSTAVFASGNPLEDVSVSLVINGESPIVKHGSKALVGSHVDPQGRWTVSWSYAVEGDPTDVGSVKGKATFKNTSGQPAIFDFILDAPLCPIIKEESLMGGTLSLKVTAGPGGAHLTSVDESPVFAALADGQVGGTIFAAPFVFGGGGGIMSTNGSFGSGYLGALAPAVENAAGMRLNFSMTDGNTAVFTSTFYFGAEPENIANCSKLGDLNGDGKVGVSDLMILLTSWGPCEGCAADLSGDGKVGVMDLVILLGNWGS